MDKELNERIKKALAEEGTKNRRRINKLIMPVAKDAKKKLDEWANDNINLPMAEAGHEDAGAAISAVISSGGEVLIPEDLADVALSFVPGGKIARSAKKGMKVIKPGPTINYKDIEKAEKAAARENRAIIDKTADTLKYEPSGKITRKKAGKAKEDLYDDELREIDIDDL